MSDGSTDSAVKEQEMVYVRSSVGGKIESKFVGIDAVDKADAENTTKAIKDVMDKVCQQWEVKLVVVATDGAAVMAGARTGVVQRLRRDRPYVVGVHCMAHSPLNRSHLKNSFATLELAPIMATRIGGTRWVAQLLRAIDHFLRGYPAIMHHLNRLSSPPISEFDPSAAVELWHTDCIRGRRPNFKDCSKQVADTDSDMSDSEADDVVIT
ncbi:hypothetical protein ABVT39_019037 [Epinephelus coioides]